MQDTSEDLAVQIITIEFGEESYLTTITTKAGDKLIKDERKTDSLELAGLEHNIAVTRLIKKGVVKTDVKIPDVTERPEMYSSNPYLYKARSFTDMLPGTEE